MANLPFIKNQVREASFKLVNDIKGDLISAGKEATGKLVNSVRFEIVDTGSIISAIFKAEKHWQFVDKGRRKGKFPPVNAIKKWIRARSISIEGATIDQAAFLIGRSIANNDIEPTNIFTDNTEDFTKDVASRIQQFGLADMQSRVAKALKTNTKK